MNFVSIEFLIFLVIVLVLLFLLKNPLFRKLVLLAASCLFCAWWDWRFLLLLVIHILLNFHGSRFLAEMSDPGKRKSIFWISIAMNLGFLCYFKYFNFFIDTLNVFAGILGWRLGTLNIILPIGISFYTFVTISYLTDVYKKAEKPAGSFLDYAIFIIYFPRLVAGPITRAREFLPQLEQGVQISFNGLVEGLQLFLWGLIKKLVIADNAAIMVEQIYQSPSMLSSPTIWLGVAAYSVQILCDFSGYTDMARGISRMLGIELPINFNLPYSAQSITEFWQRWHISLSTWLRDYLFLPLAYSTSRKLKKDRYWRVPAENIIYVWSTLITFLCCGLWHGAAWKFVLWGALHGILISLERLVMGAKPPRNPWTSYKAWIQAFIVFILVTLTWVPFRSPDWQTTIIIFKKLLFFEFPYNFAWYFVGAVFTIPVVVLGGFLARRFKWECPIFPIQKNYTIAFILLEILVVFFFTPLNISPFIYSQF